MKQLKQFDRIFQNTELTVSVAELFHFLDAVIENQSHELKVENPLLDLLVCVAFVISLPLNQNKFVILRGAKKTMHVVVVEVHVTETFF